MPSLPDTLCNCKGVATYTLVTQSGTVGLHHVPDLHDNSVSDTPNTSNFTHVIDNEDTHLTLSDSANPPNYTYNEDNKDTHLTQTKHTSNCTHDDDNEGTQLTLADTYNFTHGNDNENTQFTFTQPMNETDQTPAQFQQQNIVTDPQPPPCHSTPLRPAVYSSWQRVEEKRILL